MTEKKPLPDKEERQKISRDLDKTFLVEAGAGSGKTRNLVNRMIALLQEGKCRIENLAAVTFTKKAAGELQGRFQTELEKTVVEMKEKKDPGEERISQAIHNLEQVFIGTIHSFCAKLLRERPVEIALDPDFEEMEEVEDALYRKQTWHEFMIEAKRKHAPLINQLEEAGISAYDLEDAYNKLSLYPEVRLMPGSHTEPDYDDLRQKLNHFLDKAQTRIPGEKPAKGYDSLQLLMLRCLIRRRNLGFSSPKTLMKTYEILDRQGGITQNRWPSKEEALEFKSDFETFKEEVVGGALEKWREFRHSRVLDFLKPALAYYEQKRLSRARLNFQDQLLLASRLLRENPEVRKYFSKRYTRILVDEFQDTDPIQAEVLFYLTGEDKEEKDWKKLVPAPGALFLVGDPKQSIYRFRRADIDTYNIVKEQIRKNKGEVLYLTTNFRSVPSLTDWNNPIFRDVFPEKKESQFQARFAPLNPFRDEDENLWHGIYKTTIPKMRGNKKDDIALFDARRIARFIEWACEGNVRLKRAAQEIEQGLREPAVYSDFLILLRFKENMNLYARALERRSIPFEITGSDTFSQSEAINHILNLARALREPDNPIHTVAVLRGLFFGISDQELFQYKMHGGWFHYLKSGDKSPEQNDAEKKIRQCLHKMREWWEWKKAYPATVVLEKILDETGIISYLASSEIGSSKAGNVFKMLEILKDQETGGTHSFSQLVEFMEEIASSYELEEISLTPGKKNAVRLMNLHKVKGLEAPVVFLANPRGKKHFEPDKHIIRKGDEPQGYFLLDKKVGFQREVISHPVDWNEKLKTEKKYEEAEEARLMYVATTRARNMMVISTYEENLKYKSWYFLDQYFNEAPELKFGKEPEEKGEKEREKMVLGKGEWKNAQKELTKQKQRVEASTYRVETVTNMAKSTEPIPSWTTQGKGESWGRAVHNLLKLIGESMVKDLELQAENVLTAEERNISEKGELVRLIKSITASTLWERMLKAKKKFYEIPFSVQTDLSSLDLINKDNTKDLQVVLNGVIDLVFLEEDGWVIADYKTDKINGGLQRFIDYYTPQIQIYTEFWEKITKQKVKEAGLYFTSINRWVRI